MSIIKVLKMSDLDLSGRRVLIREDLNVPLKNGHISDATRIEKALPALKFAIQHKARVTVLSHLGRPTPGKFDPEASLAPIAQFLSEKLNQPVPLIDDWLNGVDIKPGQLILAENVRFLPGEEENDLNLAKRMANQCDIFVMDAFATAHRAQASTVGVSQYAPVACAGPLLMAELEALSKALEHPRRPLLAVVGGAKVSTKFQLLQNLLKKVNGLIVGGGIANTLLVAAGYSIGKSLFEADWIPAAKSLLIDAQKLGVDLPLPQDVVVAKQFSADASAVIKSVDAVTPDDIILDVGPQTTADYAKKVAKAGTIVWNGPLGVFEFPQFTTRYAEFGSGYLYQFCLFYGRGRRYFGSFS